VNRGLWKVSEKDYVRCNLQAIKIASPTINTLNADLNPIYHLLALLGVYPILHVSMIRVKDFTPANTVLFEHEATFFLQVYKPVGYKITTECKSFGVLTL
jgi:hypothetical protein